MTRFIPIAGLILGLILSGCSSVLTATRDTPIENSQGTRTMGSKIDDPVIETKVAVNVAKAHTDLEHNSRIVAVSYNGVILLTGQTPRAELKTLAGQAASKVQQVKKVHNELQIGNPIPVMTRSNDTWLTTKVKSKMVGTSDVPSTRIKVVTENGVVYLMGLVTRAEANNATKVVQSVAGVQKVVRLFEYLD